MTSRFPSDAVDTTLQSDTGVNYELNMGFSVTGNVDIIGVYFYTPHTQNPVYVHLFESGVAGPIAEKGPVTLTVGDNEILFDTPVSIVPGDSTKEYYVGVRLNGGSGATVYYTATVLTPPHTEDIFTTPGKNDAAHIGFFTTSTPVSGTPDSAFSGSNNWYGVAALFNNPTPPTTLVMNAGADQTATTDTTVSFTATYSGETGSVTQAWTKVSGPTATINNPTSLTMSFTPTVAGTYVFRITGTDSLGTATDDVQIVVSDPVVAEGVLWVQDPSTNVWTRIKAVNSTPALITTPGEFKVANYKTDSNTDQEATQLAINAALEDADNNNGQVNVLFDDHEYAFPTAPSGGNDGLALGQLTLDYIPGSTRKKITLTLKGFGDNASAYYWGQHAPQSIGTVWKSTYVDSVGGSSVLSGPLNLSGVPQDDFATFSNMNVIIDGIQIQTPYNSKMSGLNFKRIAQCTIPSFAHFTDRSRFTSPVISDPGNDTAGALIMPAFGNNARNEIGTIAVEGLGIGVVIGEHCQADYIVTVYCYKGIMLGAGSAGTWPDGREKVLTHAVTIDQLLCEAVQSWVSVDGGEGNAQLLIGALDGEGTPAIAHVDDPSNKLYGRIANMVDIYAETFTVNGAANLHINNGNLPRGAITAPSMPASTVALQNPFWRDASVYVSGGTVNTITIDGANTGQTSGHVRVPSGKSIAITYTSAPTWAWILD
jgi:hypothetical protein